MRLPAVLAGVLDFLGNTRSCNFEFSGKQLRIVSIRPAGFNRTKKQNKNIPTSALKSTFFPYKNNVSQKLITHKTILAVADKVGACRVKLKLFNFQSS